MSRGTLFPTAHLGAGSRISIHLESNDFVLRQIDTRYSAISDDTA